MAFDEEHDDGLGGRSRARREVTESWRWGRQLLDLPAWHTAAIPMPDKLRTAIADGRTITSPIAKKRQIGHIDSLIRDLEDDERDAIEHAMTHPPQGSDPDSVVRDWVQRLKADGDAAIDALLDAFPAAERQRARQCVRSGKDATIERYLRELLA